MYSDRESAARKRDRPRGDERFLDRRDAHNQRRRAYERKSRIFKRNRARAVPAAEQRVVQILLELNNVFPPSPWPLKGRPAEEPRRQRATPLGTRPAAAGVHGQSQRDGNVQPSRSSSASNFVTIGARMPGGLCGRAAVEDAPLRISDRSVAPPGCNEPTIKGLPVSLWRNGHREWVTGLLERMKAVFCSAMQDSDRIRSRMLLRFFVHLASVQVLDAVCVRALLNQIVDSAMAIARTTDDASERSWQPYTDFIVYSTLIALP